MNKMILILISILGMATMALASKPETLTLRAGQQKIAPRSGISIKFVTVSEDSRCPADAQCVWSGNAKVQVVICDSGGGTKKAEMNTDMGPKGDQFNGWAIYLTSLTPVPKSNSKIDPKKYKATFSIIRLQR